jgi:hypothetical protein
MYTFDENIVSDLHKDARGYRPSQSWLQLWDESHSSRKQEIWDDLCEELEQAMALEELDQARALAKLSDRILETIKLGADDTKTAIKWIIEAEEFSDFDLQFGADYFCYHFGLNYSVKSKFPIQEAMNEMLAEVV